MNGLTNTPMSIHRSRDFVLEQAKANIEFIKASPANVGQAKQINTARKRPRVTTTKI